MRPTALLVLLAGVAHAEPTWNQLRSPEAEATSFLKSNWNKYTENYHPTYVLDEDAKTAWVEGKDGQGEGEVLAIPVSALKSARGVKVSIRNGYQKTDKLLTANSAPKDVKIRVIDAAGAVVATQDATLERKMGWQDVTIDTKGRGFCRIEIEIVSVHPGSAYKDTCVSDVLVHADSDVPYNAAVEAQKLATAKAWIAERVEVAKYWATQPPDNPFAFSHYDGDYSDPAPASVEPHLATARVAFAQVKALPTWYRGDVKKRLAQVPDGSWELEELVDVLRPEEIAFFEADDDKGRHDHRGETIEEDGQKYEIWSVDRWYSNYKVEWSAGPGSAPRRLYFTLKTTHEERMSSTTTAEYLVEYGDNGRPSRIYSVGTTDDEMGEGTYESVTTFEYDAANKIVGYTTQTVQKIPSWEHEGTFDTTATARTYKGA